MAAAGFGFVVIDFRALSIDLLADPAGWALLVYAFHRLAVPRLALLAGVGFLASFAEAWLPYRYRTLEYFTPSASGEPIPVEIEVLVYDPVTGLRLALLAVSTVVLGVVTWWLVRVLRDRARSFETGRTVRTLRALALGVLAAWVAPHLIAMATGALGDDGYDVVWNDPGWRIELLGTVVFGALVVVLLANAREPWGIRPGRRRLGNWHDRDTPGTSRS